MVSGINEIIKQHDSHFEEQAQNLLRLPLGYRSEISVRLSFFSCRKSELRNIQFKRPALSAVFCLKNGDFAATCNGDFVAFVQILHCDLSGLAPYSAVDPSGFILTSTSSKSKFRNLTAAELLEFRILAKIAMSGDVEH